MGWVGVGAARANEIGSGNGRQHLWNLGYCVGGRLHAALGKRDGRKRLGERGIALLLVADGARDDLLLGGYGGRELCDRVPRGEPGTDAHNGERC